MCTESQPYPLGGQEKKMRRFNSNLRNTLFAGFAFISFSVSSNPEPLKPLPLVRTTYDLAIFNSLLGDESPELWMLAIPSFAPQYAIILDKRIESKDGKANGNKPYLKFSSFKKKLSFDPPFNPKQPYNIDSTKMVECYEIQIEDDFAKIIKTAWLRTLKQTRYTESKSNTLLDGTTYIFHYCEKQGRDYYGMTTLQSADIVELSSKLTSLAKSTKKERDVLLKECTELALRIINKETPTSASTLSPATQSSK